VLDVGADGSLSAVGFDGQTELGTADTLDAVTAEGLARQLAPLRLTGGGRGEAALSSDLGLAELLDLGDPYLFDPSGTWVQRPNRDKLRVMFGIESDGTPIELDLKESAQDGMGPHGLLIGATGSGKSELLRTLVLALAVTHPPNTLNFALIDFKGGATFTRLDRLPHTSAVITNLSEELHLVDRMTDALNGELLRRQELLRAAGSFSSLRDYERARAAGAPLDEVPVLLVIVDEFSELLSAKPDFIDTFVQIGRVGRSLGVHLLLASQRLEEGRLRGLDAHLSYRIGLRTFSAMDSRSVLGVTDAYELPRAPGHGFLQFGVEPMVRFRSAYVSGVHRRQDEVIADGGELPAHELYDYSTTYLPTTRPADENAADAADGGDDEDAVGESLLEILADRLAGRGIPAHQVWLAPLDQSPSLDQLLQPIAESTQRGLCSTSAQLAARLRTVVGLVDRPYEQRRDPLTLDLSGSGGHVLVMGGPRSGKSTALRTVITSLALTHTPREVQFYGIDLGGGSLATLRDLPHVGGVAGRQNPGAVRRTVAEVAALLADRERFFAEHDIDGMAGYRQARASGQFADHRFGDVFLVIDGWSTLLKELEPTADQVCEIVARGLAYGVHVVVSCARLFELRGNIRDFFGSKLELRLGDPIDTTADRMAALSVPEDSPGRGVTTSKHQMLMAVPRIDGVSSDDGLQSGIAAMVRMSSAAWRHEVAPQVRMLPSTVRYQDLPADEPSNGSMPVSFGIAEQNLGPVRLDFGVDPHVLLLGDTQSGKTTFLRALARRITDTYTPEQARLIVIDYRR
ncbi:MAG: type VII secretion protein EccCb, partial [Thermocrispum sp.]